MQKLSGVRYRTRKALLRAAADLARSGSPPTIDAVAEIAMVSRATVYRYFPNIDTLLAEASVDIEVPDPEKLFEGDSSTDPVRRLDKAEAAMHEVTYANEAALRHTLAAAVLHSLHCDRTGIDGKGQEKSRKKASIPVRQNRRQPLIEAALEPVRGRLSKATYERLCASLALVFGLESMIVFRDVLPLSSGKARKVKSWMMRALVNAALKEAIPETRSGK